MNPETCSYCFLDFDIEGRRKKLATSAAFVDATDSRYGFTSKDLLSLGGSEVSRVAELIETDHEWSFKNTDCDGIITKPPSCGNRIIVRLFWDVAPMACENFATLCGNGHLWPGEQGKPKPAPMGECGKPLSYRNVKVHRVVPGFVLQSGDISFGNGSGGESIFGKKFKDERLGLQLCHDRRGVLSMGNSGKNSNTSQFFITFGPCEKTCDGKHVIFGEVLSGFQILDEIEKLGTPGGEPSSSIFITDCGIYTPLATPSSGFWYDKPDSECFSGVSPIFVVRPRVAIVAPSYGVQQKFAAAIGSSGTVVSSISTDEIASPDDQCSKITSLLESYVADVVLVAAACWNSLQTRLSLPPSWASQGFELSQVVLVAKPVEALSKLHFNSWMATARPDWRLDGKS